MKMKTTAIYLVALLVAASASAQTTRIRPNNDTKAKEVKTVEAKPAEIPDTIYATSTKKQHGWFLPLQVIDKNDITRYNCVARFTNRNRAGRYCRLEYIDGHGNPSPGKMPPYILKLYSETDTLISQDWKEKASSGCRLDIITDPSGEQVIQERVYDANDWLVYAFSTTPIGDKGNTFVGSYKDFYGLPAEMRQSKGFSYGTLVHIIRDQWGNDSVIQHLDSKGFVKPNSDNVYKEVFVYDRLGRHIKNMSKDANDRLVIDAVGNCGVEYAWDDKHNCVSSIYMDDKWQPMALHGEVKHVYSFDNYNRQTEQLYVDEHNKPRPDSLGTYRITWKFNDFGECIEICGYDTLGRLSPFSANGTCIERTKYDSHGRWLEFHAFDRDSLPLSDSEWCSSIYQEYDSITGKCTQIAKNIAVNGVEQHAYSWQRKDNVSIEIFGDNSRIDSIFDSHNRLIRRIAYGSDGKEDESLDNAFETWEYGVAAASLGVSDPRLGDSIDVNCEHNSRRQLTKAIYWAADHSYRVFQEYNDGELSETCSNAYDQNRIQCQFDLNGFGTICRAGGSSGVMMYGADVAYTPQGRFSSFVGRDEFGEPDYISGDLIYYYKPSLSGGNDISYDENNIVIEDFGELRDRLPKMLSVEVTDSTAYQKGLMDNDIVLSYGSYRINPAEDNNFFKASAALMGIATASESKELKLFRVNPDSLTCSIVTLQLGPGTPDQHGFTMHTTYKTRRQMARIDSTVAANNIVLPAYIEHGDKSLVVAYPKDFRKDINSPFRKIVGTPAVVVGAQVVEYPEIKWTYGDANHSFGDVYFADVSVKELKGSTLRVYMTTDGKNLTSVDFVGMYPEWYVTTAHPSEMSLYSRLETAIADARNISLAREDMPRKNDLKKITKEELDSIYDRAWVYYCAEWTDVSFPMFEALADVGHEKAFVQLYKSYVGMDNKKAERLAVKAHLAGYDWPIVNYCDTLIHRGDYKAARKYLTGIESKSYYYDRSQMSLGDLVLKADNDTTTAFYHYGNALNDCYSMIKGKDVAPLLDRLCGITESTEWQDSIYARAQSLDKDKNYEASILFYEWLADNGYKRACYDVCWAYLIGSGKSQDIDKATEYAVKGANGGWFAGIITMVSYCLNCREYKEALHILEPYSTGEDGEFRTLYYCGKIYSDPQYYANDMKKAIHYYCLAATNTSAYNQFPTFYSEIIDYLKEHADLYPVECADGLFSCGYACWDNEEEEKAKLLFVEAFQVDQTVIDRLDWAPIALYRTFHSTNDLDNPVYTRLMDECVFAASVDPSDNDSQAIKQGLESDFYIMEYGDEWSVDTDRVSFHDSVSALSDRKKMLVIMRNDVIEAFQFNEGMIGISYSLKHVGAAEKSRIHNLYNQWKQSTNNQ